jgi:uncharacterized protein
MPISVSGVYRYPVKSCRGEPLAESGVEPWGLAGDRRWMIVDDDGAVVTAREHPRLVLVTPAISAAEDAITFRAPGLPDLTVPVPAPGTVPGIAARPGTSRLVPVTVWDSRLLAAEAADEAAEWLTKIVGESVRLVYLDDPARRPVNAKYSRPADRVSFADGYPLLLTSEASLAELNEWIAGGPHAAEGPLPMTRFRPNVQIAGAPAWAEDGWRRIRIGAVPFRIAKGSDRCVLTTIDPDTAVKGREPLVTLARRRRWDGKIWFGVNLIPDGPGRIRPGDEVAVLE